MYVTVSPDRAEGQELLVRVMKATSVSRSQQKPPLSTNHGERVRLSGCFFRPWLGWGFPFHLLLPSSMENETLVSWP